MSIELTLKYFDMFACYIYYKGSLWGEKSIELTLKYFDMFEMFQK